MFPYFTLFERIITLYQIMVLAGVFSVGIYATSVGKHYAINSIDIICFLLLVSIGIIFGSHILFIIINVKELFYSVSPINKMIQLFFSGSVFYGGLIGGVLTAYIFRFKFNNVDKIIYVVTPSIPLFHFFGRVGCFFTGCCFGIESNIGFTFKHSLIEIANNVKRFPVQLVEALFNLILFLILHSFIKKGYLKNKLLWVYMLCYSFMRFFIEFFRGDTYRGIWFCLSTSQIISFVLFVIALLKLFTILISYLRPIQK
ncbi:MAG: prolipoprotein diacylglyceryl transferase [Termitinemataceae bacterium]|nr:MAG: prolipoprotein diacylglyceryl transferase [Termitinemataceae bacterium]